MRVKTVVGITIGLIIVITASNFISENSKLTARLPEDRIERARYEAKKQPFTARPHRIERRPRLESGVLAAQEAAAGGGRQAREAAVRELGGAGQSSQRLQAVNSAERERQRSKYHVVPTVDGRVYTEWQVRICYYRYKQVKAAHPDSALGGFTRILHSGQPDSLMEEIPTAVVDPLPNGKDQGYVVLNRPYGFLQWVRTRMRDIPEDYVLMAEPDHLLVTPLPLWATPAAPAAFPFTYIEPQRNAHLVQRFNDRQVPIEAMAPIGNAPVQLHRQQLEAIVETWYNTSLRMKQDPEVDAAFNWILEMYAFSIACSQAPGGPLPVQLFPEMMAQPPFDAGLQLGGKPFHIVHLTYGMDYDSEGGMMYGKGKGPLYHWDKRDYSERYPPRDLPLPPAKVKAPAVEFAIRVINEASAALPGWPPPAA